jgi:hypothetical protein
MLPLHVQVRVLRDGELLFARDVPPGRPLSVGPDGGDIIPTTALRASISLLTPRRASYGLRLEAPLAGWITVSGRTLRVVEGLLADPRPEPLLLAEGDHGQLSLGDGLELQFAVERLQRGLRFRPRIEPRLALCLSGTAIAAAIAVIVVGRGATELRPVREVRLHTRPAILTLRRLRAPSVAPSRAEGATPTRLTRAAPRKRRQAPVKREDAILRRGALGLLHRDPSIARAADSTRRTLAALDATLAAVTAMPGTSGGVARGSRALRDPLLALLGGGGKDRGDGLPLPALAPALKDSVAAPSTIDDPPTAGPGREEIRKVVVANADAVRLCYERALITSPTLGEGQLLVEWEIDASGRVTHARASKDSIGDASLRTCVLGRVRGWSFPPCSRRCRVVYPFEFYTRS